ncbi:glucuronate isomerase [Cohnella yongneupensis]|uniref:Glucuronate isomerase n=1 Tax=Cohnella yongneupensis TaxID=425006 RepID=A0ABW0R4D3_9BACL
METMKIAGTTLHLHTIADAVETIVRQTPVTDMHTHLFASEFESLCLWELDDLLTYHYLISETFRWIDMPYEQFWSLSKREQADLIWRTLFVEHSPISEAASGVLNVFRQLGLDTSSRDLQTYRDAWARMTVDGHIDDVMRTAGVRDIVMTNDPLDASERATWERGGGKGDPRFHAALRVDPLLNDWDNAWPQLAGLGYRVSADWTEETVREVRRFLGEWIDRMDALYLAVSMPGDFVYPATDHRTRMIDEAMVPACQEAGIPFALMIGVRRRVNPGLQLAGDMSMKSDVGAVESLCRAYPEQKFLITMLARENQHELAVLARKFRNLMVFGCWWFLHIESMVREMTEMRLELLGLSVIPQHSDCRIFGQLLYKWEYSRRIIAQTLIQKYTRVLETGWTVTEDDVRRDCADLFGGNFWRFLGKPVPAVERGEAR